MHIFNCILCGILIQNAIITSFSMIKPPIIFKTYSSNTFPWIKSIINIRGRKVSLSSAFWQLTHFLRRMWCHHPVTKGMAWPRSKWPEDRRCARGLDKLSLNCFDTEVWWDIFKRHSDCGVNAAGGLTSDSPDLMVDPNRPRTYSSGSDGSSPLSFLSQGTTVSFWPEGKS